MLVNVWILFLMDGWLKEIVAISGIIIIMITCMMDLTQGGCGCEGQTKKNGVGSVGSGPNCKQLVSWEMYKLLITLLSCVL